MTLCSFDGGPLHEADRDVDPDEDDALPDLLVTDEGDYWALYVLADRHHWPLPTYVYDGEEWSSEVDRCPRVPPAQSFPTTGDTETTT